MVMAAAQLDQVGHRSPNRRCSHMATWFRPASRLDQEQRHEHDGSILCIYSNPLRLSDDVRSTEFKTGPMPRLCDEVGTHDSTRERRRFL